MGQSLDNQLKQNLEEREQEIDNRNYLIIAVFNWSLTFSLGTHFLLFIASGALFLATLGEKNPEIGD